MLSSIKHSAKIPRIINLQIKNIHFKDNKIKVDMKYNIVNDTSPQNMENFKKEYLPTHWINDYLPKFGRFLSSGDVLKVFDSEKDNELGRYRWNSNGGYPNRLANIFYRSGV